jgi:hypothetical protein
MISQPSLPESLISLCMNILASISDSERDLIRVIVDVVTEIRLGEDEGRDRGMSIVSDSPGLAMLEVMLMGKDTIARWPTMIPPRLQRRYDPLHADGDRVY